MANGRIQIILQNYHCAIRTTRSVSVYHSVSVWTYENPIAQNPPRAFFVFMTSPSTVRYFLSVRYRIVKYYFSIRSFRVSARRQFIERRNLVARRNRRPDMDRRAKKANGNLFAWMCVCVFFFFFFFSIFTSNTHANEKNDRRTFRTLNFETSRISHFERN